MANSEEQKTIDLLFEALDLKKIPRAGWELRRAPHESLADHSFGAALIAITLARMENLPSREEHALVVRALIHDLHEARIGDIPKVSKPYVKADSKAAEKDMLTGTCLESEIDLLNYPGLDILAHDADKLDMLFQTIDYINAGHCNLQEFVDSALSQIKSKSGKKLAKLALSKLKK